MTREEFTRIMREAIHEGSEASAAVLDASESLREANDAYHASVADALWAKLQPVLGCPHGPACSECALLSIEYVEPQEARDGDA